jgi:mono/diheme cytochrome c family protein
MRGGEQTLRERRMTNEMVFGPACLRAASTATFLGRSVLKLSRNRQVAVEHRCTRGGRLLALGCCLALAQAVAADVSFENEVEPLFRSRCQVCHGAAQQLSGLRLDSREGALKGGYSGAVIIPGDSKASRLIRVISGADEKVRMPPSGPPLTPDEIATIANWIDQGAKGPAAPALTAAPGKTKSDHWAFQPVTRPAPPSVRNEVWLRNDIDRFVLARLETQNIQPSPEAARATLARRVSLDLIGLPPTPGEIEEFLSDDNPAAYERLVDRLLESPHFGERWAIPWLDQVRYADSDGYEKDYIRPFAWRYRDWIIDSLNDDKPFDQFTIEQVAGDLLSEIGTQGMIASGFHRQTLKNREGGVKIEQFRFEETVDRANTVATVWLGLTAGCAQCHDHKYDPISQKEYYQLFAYFNQLDEVEIDAPLPGELGPYLAGLPEYRRKRHELLEKNRVLELQPPWEEQMRQAVANPGKWTDWDHALDALQKYLDGSERTLFTPPDQRTEKEAERFTDHFIKNYHRVISKELWKELEWDDLRKQLTALRNEYPALSEAPAVTMAAAPRQTHIHLRGQWDKTGIEVEPGAPAFLPPLSDGSADSRVTLATWLVSRENPLTARVTVNRIWQEYFGEGLAATPEDFGTRSPKPAHAQLLDWLASELVDGGWRLKRVHKMIVMSATYRQSSADRPELHEVDPDNRLLARQARLRLPAELIRDAALRASGLLYPAIGGASVRPPIPDGVTDLGYGSSVQWEESAGRDRYRRGLYIVLQRTVPYPQLVGFDASERAVAQCSRERSNTPLQALNLLNDPVFVEAARALAVRLLSEAETFDDRLQLAYLLCLSRPPSDAERRTVSDYLERQTRIFDEEPGAAEKFMPIDMPGVPRAEAAAWAGVASLLLNLDELITRE